MTESKEPTEAAEPTDDELIRAAFREIASWPRERILKFADYLVHDLPKDDTIAPADDNPPTTEKEG